MSDDGLQTLRDELERIATTLEARQLKMAQHILAGENHSQAYRLAGYKGKNPDADACNVLRANPSIGKYIELGRKIANAESAPRAIATFEQKKKMLWEMALASKEAMFAVAPPGDPGERGEDGKGGEMPLLNHNAVKAATQCLAELNKMDGHLAAIKTDNKTTVAFEELSDAELDAKIAEKQRKLAGKI